MTLRRLFLVLLAPFILASSAHAVDTVYYKSGDKRAAGEIAEIAKESVTVKPKIGEVKVIPSNAIAYIEWDGEPPSLGLARSKETAGQYAAALEDYKKSLDEAPTNNDTLRADIQFGIASTIGQMALADAAQQDEAITRLTAFKDANPDHYRYYNALLLLGDVQLAKGDDNAAETIFTLLASAKSPDYQMAAKVNIARVKLARDDIAGARAAFDEVAKMPAASPAEKSRQFEAMLGQASCLQQQGQNEEATKILGDVIQKSAPADTRLQAEAYLRQGDAYAALGQKTKEAVMSYLHVDVIPAFAKEKDLHAEALYRLSQLWPALGEPARADLASGRLQSEYPNSEWTKKLSGG